MSLVQNRSLTTQEDFNYIGYMKNTIIKNKILNWNVSKKFPYAQLVVEEINNVGTFLSIFQSNVPISVPMVVQYLEEEEDFNFDKGSITFVTAPENLIKLIDKSKKSSKLH